MDECMDGLLGITVTRCWCRLVCLLTVTRCWCLIVCLPRQISEARAAAAREPGQQMQARDWHPLHFAEVSAKFKVSLYCARISLLFVMGIGPCSVAVHMRTLPWVRCRVWVRVGLGSGLATGKGWEGTWPVTRLDPGTLCWSCRWIGGVWVKTSRKEVVR